MKNRKLLFVPALLMTLGLVSCSGGDAHHYGDSWETNKTQHWHKCGDEGCEEKDALGDHELVEDPALAVAPKCETAGKKVEVCSVCGYKKETKVDALKHEYEDVPAEAVLPTCGVPGKTVQKCKICNNKKETPVAALEHEWVDDAAAAGNVAATHTSEGVKIQKCTKCTETKRVTTPVVPHDFQVVAGAATTNSEGKTVNKLHCSCGVDSYAMAVKDYSFLTEGSNSFWDGTIAEGDAPEAGEGIRVAGGGQIMWKFPVAAAGRYAISIGANAAPSAIGNPNIQQKNGVTVDGVAQEFIPQGGYTALGIPCGSFKEIVLAEFNAPTAKEYEIAITQVASQRLFWGENIKLTPVAAN